MLKYCNSNDYRYSLKLNLFLQKTMKQLRCSVYKSTNTETSSTISLVDIPSDIHIYMIYSYLRVLSKMRGIS